MTTSTRSAPSRRRRPRRMAAPVWANMAARQMTSKHADGWADLRESARLDRWADALSATLDLAPCADLLAAAACLDSMGHGLGAMVLREAQGEPCKRGERADMTGCIPATRAARQRAQARGQEVPPEPEAKVAARKQRLTDRARKAAEARWTKHRAALGTSAVEVEALAAKPLAIAPKHVDAALAQLKPLADWVGTETGQGLTQSQTATVARVAAAMPRFVDQWMQDGSPESPALVAHIQRAAGASGDLSAWGAASAGALYRTARTVWRVSAPVASAMTWGALRGASSIAGLALDASRYVAELGLDGIATLARTAPPLALGLVQLAAWPLSAPPFLLAGSIAGSIVSMQVASAAGVATLSGMATAGLVPLAVGGAALALRKVAMDRGGAETPLDLFVSRSGRKSLGRAWSTMTTTWRSARTWDVLPSRR